MYAFICCKYYINSIYNIKIHKLHFYKLCFELYEKIVFFFIFEHTPDNKTLKKSLVIRLRKMQVLCWPSGRQHVCFTPYISSAQPYIISRY